MITVKRKVQFGSATKKARRPATAAAEPRAITRGRIPRISRLMALAIRLEQMLRRGEVSDIADLARLNHVTQPRMSQILALTLLAPDIQESLLFLPLVTTGSPPIHEKMLRPISAEIDWGRQREMWSSFRQTTTRSVEP